MFISPMFLIIYSRWLFNKNAAIQIVFKRLTKIKNATISVSDFIDNHDTDLYCNRLLRFVMKYC